jgi:RNA polymerase sigma factor (sigma-70 family)
MKILEEFFRTEYDGLVKKALFRVRNPDDAEDVVMDAFRRAVEYWESYDPDNKELGAWFNTILNNSVRTFQREKFMKHVEVDREVEIPVQETYEEDDLFRNIQEDLDRIDNPNRRYVLHLFFNLGYSYKDIEMITEESVRNARYFVEEFKREMRDKYE